jgi:dTDP-4-amino-4,6-dideoxygalactose transaminase
VYHQYTIRVHNGQRDRLQTLLKEAGIDTFVYYPVPLHRLPVYEHSGDCLPEAERASKDVLSLPMSPLMNLETQQQVADKIRALMEYA